MAFKKSKLKSQPDLFATASFSLPERERRYQYERLLSLCIPCCKSAGPS